MVIPYLDKNWLFLNDLLMMCVRFFESTICRLASARFSLFDHWPDNVRSLSDAVCFGFAMSIPFN